MSEDFRGYEEQTFHCGGVTPVPDSAPRCVIASATVRQVNAHAYVQTRATPVGKTGAAVCINLLQIAQHLGACACDRRVGIVAAGKRRPAALLDERTLLV